jgi:CheY-like chemotaxis protein
MSEPDKASKPAPRILLVDDDRQFLRLYRDLLAKQPSAPDVRTAENGSRALAKLEGDRFDLLVCDLKMAQVDGLQVLAIVRKRFPELRTVVITGLTDEQFRARAYALGVDLFLEKPTSTEESKIFLECIESLLGPATNSAGFRGVQSKSLVDIIQLECLSLSSSVLKVVQGVQEGHLWFLNGEIIDADVGGVTGEEAFRRILSWKTGAFEILPPEPARKRTIFGSYQSLLLETAQALDEAISAAAQAPATAPRPAPLAEGARTPGIEFILATGDRNNVEAWGVENSEKLGQWTRETVQRFQNLGERLKIGAPGLLTGETSQRRVVLVRQGDRTVCLGAQKAFTGEQLRETLNQISLQWAS